MLYERNELGAESADVVERNKCNNCGKKLSDVSDAVFFTVEYGVEIQKGFLCSKCADEYERKYLL